MRDFGEMPGELDSFLSVNTRLSGLDDREDSPMWTRESNHSIVEDGSAFMSPWLGIHSNILEYKNKRYQQTILSDKPNDP